MADQFHDAVSMACHDLRTPLATISGFAKTLTRSEALDARSAGYAAMIDAAADEFAKLVDEAGSLAQIESGRYKPTLVEANSLLLATSADKRVATVGTGETVQTDEAAVQRSLEALAVAAARYGGLDQVTWTASGRELRLEPVTAEAGPVVAAEELRDFGAMVARRVIEALGGTIALEGETLRVSL